MCQNRFSNQIYWYNYILAILIILIHTENTLVFTEAVPFLNALELVIVEKIARPAVAAFFLCSGYLFYRNFSFSMLIKKWKSRWNSLVIPFLVWNLIYYFISWLVANLPFFSNFYPDNVPVSFKELFCAAFLCKYNLIFWFLQYLIIYVILCPIIYILVKNRWLGIISIVGILVLADSQTLLNLSDDLASMCNWLFIYLIGAYAGIHLKKQIEDNKSTWLQVALILLFTVLMFFGVSYSGRLCTTLLYYLGISILIWIVLGLVQLPEARPWMKIAFYIYAVHFMIVRFGNKMICLILGNSMYMGILAFFGLPIIVLILCGWTSGWLSKYTPILWKLLSGNRGVKTKD